MVTMRAKMRVTSVTHDETQLNAVELKMHAVCGDTPFGPNGESEDNTFARFTPLASFEIYITNPDLLDAFQPGQIFYVDFTRARQDVLGG